MKAVFIIAQVGYQDLEYNIPKKILENAGIETVTASKRGGTCSGKLGGMVKDTLALADVKAELYDAVIFIGGPGAVNYQQDAEAHKIAQEAKNSHKLLAAICIAPTILAYAGVLERRKATVWNEDGQQERVLTSHGVRYVNESVVVDGKIITANGPAAAEKFGKKILEMLNR
ncbi:MAG: DJ-1/PfpI family protein [Nanoarchaeota archaeon]